MKKLVQVIIPAYNEEQNLERLLPYLKKIADDSIRVVVVDGGSTDQTVQVCKKNNINVISAQKKGRAPQMNEGAKKSEAYILYFLHADTIPPNDIFQRIRSAVANGYESGCCQLKFDEENLVMDLYSWFTRFDLLPFRFGDQSLFCRRDVFFELGGFDESFIVMEDNYFIKKLRSNGSFTVLNEFVTTSAEKYRENGFIRLQLIFSFIFILFYLGASQDTLVAIYKEFIRQDKV